MFDLPPLTLLHVLISFAGIISGFVVIWGMISARRLEGWTLVFLVTTVATSVTGFVFFPLSPQTPAQGLGVISLIVLAIAIYARYPQKLAGRWRGAYVISAVAAQYFNFFALIVQSFLKVPALHDLAPTQSEPPFAIAQLVALVAFVGLGIQAFRKFRV